MEVERLTVEECRFPAHMAVFYPLMSSPYYRLPIGPINVGRPRGANLMVCTYCCLSNYDFHEPCKLYGKAEVQLAFNC
jgi:hypothetical protein